MNQFEVEADPHPDIVELRGQAEAMRTTFVAATMGVTHPTLKSWLVSGRLPSRFNSRARLDAYLALNRGVRSRSDVRAVELVAKDNGR